jgi:hypothetical protein
MRSAICARAPSQALVRDAHVARLAPQPRAAAIRAGLQVDELGELLPHRLRIGLAIAPLEARQDALERVFLDAGAAALVRIVEGHLLLAGPVQDDVLHALVEHLPGLLDVEAVVLGERLQHRVIEVVAPVPAADRAARKRQVGMRDDALRVEELDRAQAVAARARAHRIVEGEKPRLELGQRVLAARRRTGVARREKVLAVRIGLDHQRAAVGVSQCRLERLGQPLLGVGAHPQAVDHHVDRMLDVLRKARRGVELVDLAVHAHPREALRAQLFEKLGLLALAAGDDRREHHDTRVFRQREQLVHHLRHAVRLQREPVLGAKRRADARVQQAQIVVDLGHRADGGARIVARRLLLDGDRGRQSLDQVDVGLLHELQELARIRRQRLDVAALALGVQRVEGERALARAGETGDDDEALTRQLDAQVLQVVRARAANADGIQAAAGKAKLATIARFIFPPHPLP